jgi:hypothetical protein
VPTALKTGIHSLIFRVVEAWSMFPGEIKRSKGVSSFKRIWWRTAKRWNHSRTHPTWVIRCKSTRNKQQCIQLDTL